jgi:hypothetical protein
MAVAHEQPTVAGDGQTERTSTGVADDLGGPGLGVDAEDVPADDPGVHATAAVDDHVLRGEARQRDDPEPTLEVGFGKVPGPRRLPADGIDRRSRYRSHRREATGGG